LVAGIVPRIERHPLQKLKADEPALLRLLRRWRDEATKAGRPKVNRIAAAYEAGRDGFWLARWLQEHGVRMTGKSARLGLHEKFDRPDGI
jgi:transposase